MTGRKRLRRPIDPPGLSEINMTTINSSRRRVRGRGKLLLPLWTRRRRPRRLVHKLSGAAAKMCLFVGVCTIALIAFCEIRILYRNNHDQAGIRLTRSSSIDPTSIQNELQTDHQQRNYSNADTTQRILLLAGPHKTGSSTFQTIFVHFTNVYSHKWAMADPWSDAKNKFNVIKLDRAKHFAALIFPMIGQEDHPLFVNPPVNQQDMIDIFRSDIYTKWNDNIDPIYGRKNLVLGSEELDQIIADHLNGDEILENILSILPPNTREVIDVIVTYRSPKVKHLLSLWKEVGVQMRNETFSEFIFNPESFLHIHTIESLPLANLLLRKGLKVTLVDIGGLKKYGVETVQLLGCDLMKERCDENGVPDFLLEALQKYPDLMNTLKESVNVRTGGIQDLEEYKLDQIETAMLQYDCGYREILSNENLNVLYDASFLENMNKCEPRPKKMGRRELWNRIKLIADTDRANVERKKRVILFAGPHFSSTAFMHVLSIHFSAMMPNKWSWLAPPSIQFLFNLTEPAYLASLMFALSDQTNHPLFTRKVTKEMIYGQFKEEMSTLFTSEKNVLLGSEEVDRISSEFFSGDEILGELMKMVTPNADQELDSRYEVTVVIGYTSPRVDQLLSLWHEVAKPTKKNLYEFTKDPNSIQHLHTIDPLALADKFLGQGVKVVLIDIAGQKASQLELYQTLACDIMLEACDTNKNPLFINDHRKFHPEIENALINNPTTVTSSGSLRRESHLSDKQLYEIEMELQRRDCSFRHSLLGHGKLAVLYDTAFSTNMDKCISITKRPVSREDMWYVISAWADPMHDLKASFKASLYGLPQPKYHHTSLQSN